MSFHPPLQSDNQETPTSLKQSCQEAIHQILQKNVQVLAIDFDLTLVNQHTRGRWTRSPQELAQHVRPLFQDLFPIAQGAGIWIVIVTFSSQTELIQEVLRISMPKRSLEFVNAIPVVGGFPSDFKTIGKKVSIVPESPSNHRIYPVSIISHALFPLFLFIP